MSPKCIAITSIILNVFAFVFSIWGVAEMIWLRKVTRALYWIGFILALLALIGTIAIVILIFVRNSTNEASIGGIGKIICIVVRVCVGLASLLFLISTIILIVDYARIENLVYGYSVIPGRYWAAAIVPTIWYIILMSIIDICTKALYVIFDENIYTTIKDHEIQIPPNNLNSTKISTLPINPNQQGIPGVFIPTTNQAVINQTTTGKDMNVPVNNMNNLNNPGYPVNNITTALPKNN
jgi:hypothetical protein